MIDVNARPLPRAKLVERWDRAQKLKARDCVDPPNPVNNAVNQFVEVDRIGDEPFEVNIACALKAESSWPPRLLSLARFLGIEKTNGAAVCCCSPRRLATTQA